MSRAPARAAKIRIDMTIKKIAFRVFDWNSCKSLVSHQRATSSKSKARTREARSFSAVRRVSRWIWAISRCIGTHRQESLDAGGDETRDEWLKGEGKSAIEEGESVSMLTPRKDEELLNVEANVHQLEDEDCPKRGGD